MALPSKVYISISGRMAHMRRFHTSPDCASILSPLEVSFLGPYGAEQAGYKICLKCYWRDMREAQPGRKVRRPTCREAGPFKTTAARAQGKFGRPRQVKCALTKGHKGDHYVARGPGLPGSYRWNAETAYITGSSDPLKSEVTPTPPANTVE